MASGKPAVLVQYIAVRKDLLTALHWPFGALIAQACHASSAVLHLHRDDPDTQAYLAVVDSMRKVVLEVCVCTYISVYGTRVNLFVVETTIWMATQAAELVLFFLPLVTCTVHRPKLYSDFTQLCTMACSLSQSENSLLACVFLFALV